MDKSKEMLGKIYQLCTTWLPKSSFAFDSAELKSEVPSVQIVAADLTNWTSTEKALKNVGNIDLLVNSAGVVFLESAAEITEEKMKL